MVIEGPVGWKRDSTLFFNTEDHLLSLMLVVVYSLRAESDSKERTVAKYGQAIWTIFTTIQGHFPNGI